MKCAHAAVAVCAGGLVLMASPLRADWPQFARTADRRSVADSLPDALGAPRWVVSAWAGAPIRFNGQSGVVIADGRAVALGRHEVQPVRHIALAVDVASGSVLWTANVPAPHLDSWSAPAASVPAALVVVASGTMVSGLDLATGAVRWQAALQRPVVNASPVVTGDLAGRNRAFITDFDGFGGAGRLYCINIDPFDAALNPFQPGEVVWSAVLGNTSGNTPAYADGVVYVASVADTLGGGAGRILAFDATAHIAPEPLWTFENPVMAGFFGGVTVRDIGAERFIFAASYALYGGQFAANMVKVRAGDGSLVWTVPSNRTDATPIMLGDGRIALSGGIRGFGSAPSIQLFHDSGGSAGLLWDSALDSWVDLNNNTLMDPGEYLLVGGWTHQPAATLAPGGAQLAAGAIRTNTFEACNDLYLLDLERHPSESGFIISHVQGAGSTPAVSDGAIVTIGPGGLHALGGGCWANCDGSSIAPMLNIDDFSCYINAFAAAQGLPAHEQQKHYANCDGSTIPPVLNVDDFTCFINRFAGGCP